MNDDTKFLINRMDTFESRVMDEFKELHAFKNRLAGIAMVAGATAALVIELIAKKLS